MDQVPFIRQAVRAGVLAHGADANAIAESDVSDLQWIEKARNIHSLKAP
jgi:hypothetical protein